MTHGWHRARDGMIGYAWLGPFHVEYGDGIVLRIGERRYIAVRVRAKLIRGVR